MESLIVRYYFQRFPITTNTAVNIYTCLYVKEKLLKCKKCAFSILLGIVKLFFKVVFSLAIYESFSTFTYKPLDSLMCVFLYLCHLPIGLFVLLLLLFWMAFGFVL